MANYNNELNSKVTFLEQLATRIVQSKERSELETIVWDIVFDELMAKSWADVTTFAEDYPVLVQEVD